MLMGGDMFRLWGTGTDDGPIDQVCFEWLLLLL